MLKEGIFLGQRYEIQERIGSGGMADVYRGKDHKLNRFVAVKVLKSDYRSDKIFIQKFLSEAQAAAGLMHQNVVNVYDVGQDRGLYYMVMELVEGITLKDYIEKKERLTGKEAISIAIQMVSGIQAAHNRHIVHRDIKPQNIIISNDGKVKVTDFGIARATTSTNTISTNVMGSVHYTSPEQARGGIVDEKSDIYSAGVTLYEMVTGHVPFDGDSTVTVALKHLKEPFPHPTEEFSDISPSLESIILKCVEKSPSRRYQNCEELILDLKRAMLNQDNGRQIKKVSGGTETVVMSKEELERLQQRQRRRERPEENNYRNNRVDDRRRDGNRQNKNTGRQESAGKDTRKAMKILLIVAAAVIAIAAVFVIGNAVGVFKSVPKISMEERKKEVTVPDLLGKTEKQAQETLNKKGLGFAVAGRKPSEHYKSGQIMEQTIEAGTKVDKNTQISVIVSTGAEVKTTSVPNVVGKTESEAQKMLADANLVVDASSEYDDTVEAGKVISTDPAAGTELKEGETVKMVVSLGKEQTRVPKITGKTQAEAEAILSENGLAGSASSEYSDSVPEGTVISQNPAEGEKIDSGATVSYVVSLGPEETLLAVPTLINKSRIDAEELILSSGFKNGGVTFQYSDTVTADWVISQTVAPGTQLAEGTAIGIVVSLGPENKTEDPGQEEQTTEPEGE